MQANTIKILALCGSLRPNSSNHSIIRYLAATAPAGVECILYEGIESLPHFNPALDVEDAIEAVKQLREAISQADGVLVCTPEYAFGVPGSLKNALDWTVSSGSLNGKPAAIVTASSSGEKAHPALLQIFTALGARVAGGAALLVPYIRTKINNQGELTNEATRQALLGVMEALLGEINTN